ncbi:hypothetical protein [Sulfuricurvum sp.]|uniref:hypothetical protein n=1 Tax=Sulfuricurvum sp. TaxID=2025608 RepID=UPI003BB11484
MTQIDWEQFKKFKLKYSNRKGFDNFQLLLEYIRSVDKLISPDDILEILREDVLSQQMLEKREITEVAQIEEYLYTILHG